MQEPALWQALCQCLNALIGYVTPLGMDVTARIPPLTDTIDSRRGCVKASARPQEVLMERERERGEGEGEEGPDIRRRQHVNSLSSADEWESPSTSEESCSEEPPNAEALSEGLTVTVSLGQQPVRFPYTYIVPAAPGIVLWEDVLLRGLVQQAAASEMHLQALRAPNGPRADKALGLDPALELRVGRLLGFGRFLTTLQVLVALPIYRCCCCCPAPAHRFGAFCRAHACSAQLFCST